jgi:hypothetical protein
MVAALPAAALAQTHGTPEQLRTFQLRLDEQQQQLNQQRQNNRHCRNAISSSNRYKISSTSNRSSFNGSSNNSKPALPADADGLMPAGEVRVRDENRPA